MRHRENTTGDRPSVARGFAPFLVVLTLLGCAREPAAPREVPVSGRSDAAQSEPAPDDLTQPPRAIATH